MTRLQPRPQRILGEGQPMGNLAHALLSVTVAGMADPARFRRGKAYAGDGSVSELEVEPGLLRVASNNAEQEEAVDELDIDYGGDAIEIGFNVTYLIDALSNMSQDMVKLELQDSNSSALLTNPENNAFKYVVMPMRI